MTDTAKFPADLPHLTATGTVFLVWWEDYREWDGERLYAELDTAKRYAAVGWLAEEVAPIYSLRTRDFSSAPMPVLEWKEDGEDSWQLWADGESTSVTIGRLQIYRHIPFESVCSEDGDDDA